MKNYTRTPSNYVITRKQKRYIARLKMEQEQKAETLKNIQEAKEKSKKENKKVNPEKGEKLFKHSYSVFKPLMQGKFVAYTKDPSYFAKNWRSYAEER